MQKSSQNRDEKIKALTEKLEQGIREVFTSGRYRDYLSAMQKFHRYSFGNTLLILLQKPEASLIAGYKTWQTFGRNVKKGETGIQIIGGQSRRVEKEIEVRDSETGKLKLDLDGKPVKEMRQFEYTKFFPVSVFDISQTEGEPLPTLTEELTGEVDRYNMLMEAIRKTAPVPVRFESWNEEKKGHYDWAEKEIVVKAGMSELQTIKTAVHELAHSILHTDKEHLKDSSTMEVEAESIAYIVCQHLGLDTSDYSFGYLAGWSENKELPELKSSLDTIQRTAHNLIEKLDAEILKHTNNLDSSMESEKESLKLSHLGDTHHHRR